MIIKIKTFSGETLYIPEEDYLDEVMYSSAARRAITKPGKTAALIKAAANSKNPEARYYLRDFKYLVGEDSSLEFKKDVLKTLEKTINRGGHDSWAREALGATRKLNRGAMYKNEVPVGAGKRYKKIAELRAKNQELNKLKEDKLGKHFFN